VARVGFSGINFLGYAPKKLMQIVLQQSICAGSDWLSRARQSTGSQGTRFVDYH
jgi:hypothetical protein